MNLTEQFLNEIEQCDTELKARNLIGQVYQKANTTSEGFLKAPFPLTWDVFYKLVELEKKFNLNYFASSYIALVLVKPKLSSNWAKRANLKKWSEFEDYCMEMYTHVAANVIPKWDKDVNDNFLAFLTHELLTVLNKITKPEVSSYVQKNYGRTVNSIEAIAQELGYDFDIEDKNFSTEDRVINEIEKDEKKYYQSLIFKKKDKIDKKQEDLEMKNQEIDKEKIIESEIVTKTTIEVTIETVENTTTANMDKETKEEETKPIIKKGPKIKNLDNAFSKDEIKRALIVTQIFGGLENDLNLSKRVFLALEKKENMKKKDNKENNLSIEEVVFE